MSEQNELESDAARLAAEVQESRANNRRGGSGGQNNMLVGTALAAVCGGIIAFMFWPETNTAAQLSLPTGQPEQFQTSSEAPFPRMPLPMRREPEQPQPDPALLEQIAALQAEIERLREQPQTEIFVEEDAPITANDPQIDALLDQVAELQATMNRMQSESARDLAERERHFAQLQAQLDAARITGGNYDLGSNSGELNRDLEAEEFYRARVSSPLIAFGDGGPGGGAAGAGAYPETAGIDPNLRRQSQNERFARQQASRASMEQAKIIANPANTVMQGTMIQAVLETAINTDLPGAIRALVSEDVHSFDGSRILIPRGSRVIGAYNDNTDLGQRRAMIVWNRIIMPDSQAVDIGAYGGDFIGRSGMEGVVRTHFGARFGSAALISLVGIGPALALTNEDNDSNASDIANALSQNMTGALQGTLSDYLNRKPTIAVKQGSLVTIMVDRDLEIF